MDGKLKFRPSNALSYALVFNHPRNDVAILKVNGVLSAQESRLRLSH